LFTFFILIWNSCVFSDTPVTPPASIKWQTYSDAAFADAKQQHKLVLLFGKATWCPWCQEMTRSFKDPGVATIVMYNFIPVLVDIDADAPIAKQYKILSLPTMIILDGDKKILETFTGFQEPKDLIARLQVVTLKHHNYYQ
jgi:thioredoxin-like negative regulator of GroEL